MRFRRSLALGAVALSLAAGAPALARPSGTLTVYTSQPTEQMAEVIAAFNEAHPDVEVELFRSGTTEVMNKLQAEFAAGDPKPDVLLIADAVAMTQLKEDGRLMAYADAAVGATPEALIDPDRTFFGTKLITTGIIYNTNLVQEPPRSWNDLLAEDAASSLIMPSPLYSGAAAIHVGTIVQQPELGWDYYEKLAEGGAVAGKGNGSVVEAVARGEKAYGIIIEYMALNAKEKGSPVEWVAPEDGVTIITQPVGILKTASNPEAAKAFVDWQLSEAAQSQSVRQGYYPATPDVAPPKGYPALSALKFIEADPQLLLKQDDENKRKFADLFGG